MIPNKANNIGDRDSEKNEKFRKYPFLIEVRFCIHILA